MSFDPYAAYGPVIETAIRVVTWNVWGRYGPRWETRQAGLHEALCEVEPDVVCLAVTLDYPTTMAWQPISATEVA